MGTDVCSSVGERKQKRHGGDGVKLIGDDPIIRCMERSGYPPWFYRSGTDYEERDGEADRGEDEDGKL